MYLDVLLVVAEMMTTWLVLSYLACSMSACFVGMIGVVSFFDFVLVCLATLILLRFSLSNRIRTIL